MSASASSWKSRATLSAYVVILCLVRDVRHLTPCLPSVACACSVLFQPSRTARGASGMRKCTAACLRAICTRAKTFTMRSTAGVTRPAIGWRSRRCATRRARLRPATAFLSCPNAPDRRYVEARERERIPKDVVGAGGLQDSLALRCSQFPICTFLAALLLGLVGHDLH